MKLVKMPPYNRYNHVSTFSFFSSLPSSFSLSSFLLDDHGYTSSNPINVTLRKSLDFITVNCFDGSNGEVPEGFFGILDKLGFHVVSSNCLEQGNYGWCRILSYEGNNLDVIYSPKKHVLPDFILKIHHPTRKLIDLIMAIESFYGGKLSLSAIEMSFDFFVDDPDSFSRFLNQHVFYKHQRSPAFNCEDTFYTNNIRKDRRGIRQYVKEIDGEKFARLELDLNRENICTLGLTLPLDTIDEVDLSRFFDFREFDSERLLKHINGVDRRALAEANAEMSPSSDIVISQNIAWVNSVMYGQQSLMGKIDAAKREMGLKQYPRYMTPLTDFNDKFFRALSEQKFFPDDYAEIDPKSPLLRGKRCI